MVAGDLDGLERAFSREVSAPFNWGGNEPFAKQRRDFEEHGFLEKEHGLLAVEVDGVFAGFVAYRLTGWGSPPWSSCWSIGITLLPEARGRGVGTQAQRQLADHLFRISTVARIQVDTDVDNVAELRSLEKAGVRPRGRPEGGPLPRRGARRRGRAQPAAVRPSPLTPMRGDCRPEMAAWWFGR